MATKTATAPSADAPAKKFVEKPEKPDEDKFKAEKEAIEKELQDVKDKLVSLDRITGRLADTLKRLLLCLSLPSPPLSKAVQDKISQVEPPRSTNGEKPGQNAVQKQQSELRAELSSIRNVQAGIKSSKQKIHDQIKTLDTSLKAKLADQQAAKSKIQFKSVEEIDSAIARLDSQVESGTMKIVEERKALDIISTYRRHRKTLQSLDAGEGGIAAEKAKIAELKAQLVEDPEQKRLSDRFNEIIAELDKIKAEQDEVYNNLHSLRDERTKLRTQENEQRDAKRKLERDFYAAKDSYRAYEKAAYEVRKEKIRAEREAKDKEYKRQIAVQKMEEASQPAFQAEINTCEGLIAHFDPASPEAQATKTKASLLKDAGLKALATRVVETEPKGKKLVKEEEDYFVGKPKKGKKGSAKGSGTVTPITLTVSEEKEKGKFQLNHGILAELGKVDVRAPTKWDDVPGCVEKLREKLAWYKENSERVTKENIAKAQKEVDRLERVSGKEEEESKTPVAEEEETAAELEKEEKEEKPVPVPETTEEAKEEKAD
ncbi:hypothetical protein EV426DRAFT_138169 [Tirmania nivea]|nr:hypothetical protein EV426DRAFT_138169 [Tirmania nivea]